jgi:hypothetical protein
MNSLPVTRGRLAGYLEDFAKAPAERRTSDSRVRPEAKTPNSDTSTDRASSRDAATARGGALTQATGPAAAPAPAAPLRGHLIDRLV